MVVVSGGCLSMACASEFAVGLDCTGTSGARVFFSDSDWDLPVADVDGALGVPWDAMALTWAASDTVLGTGVAASWFDAVASKVPGEVLRAALIAALAGGSVGRSVASVGDDFCAVAPLSVTMLVECAGLLPDWSSNPMTSTAITKAADKNILGCVASHLFIGGM